jgi:hypothetical protein
MLSMLAAEQAISRTPAAIAFLLYGDFIVSRLPLFGEEVERRVLVGDEQHRVR